MEIKVATRECVDQLGRPRRFCYYLTVDQIETERFCCEDYGVRISEEAGDSVSIPRVTTSAQRIDELLSLLAEHQVGPAGLADVVADWL